VILGNLLAIFRHHLQSLCLLRREHNPRDNVSEATSEDRAWCPQLYLSYAFPFSSIPSVKLLCISRKMSPWPLSFCHLYKHFREMTSYSLVKSDDSFLFECMRCSSEWRLGC
jgi:hypothetical protein